MGPCRSNDVMGYSVTLRRGSQSLCEYDSNQGNYKSEMQKPIVPGEPTAAWDQAGGKVQNHEGGTQKDGQATPSLEKRQKTIKHRAISLAGARRSRACALCR